MSLVDQAALDLETTLTSPVDFGVLFTLTDPAGFSGTEQLSGATGDIGLLIDPDTGQGVSGRQAYLVVSRAALVSAGFADIPQGIEDEDALPWIVEFQGIGFVGQKYKVKTSMPDRKLPMIAMALEFWVSCWRSLSRH